MNKEHVKSIVLVFLVMVNFVLGAKILTDKKLWPYGYNFFISLENSDIIRAFTNSSDKKVTKTHLTMPQQIIVNTGDQTSRIAVSPNEDNFSEIYDAAEDMINAALTTESKNIFFANKAEWVSVLNGKSVCLIYAVPYDTGLFGEFFGVEETVLSSFVPFFTRIVVASDKSVYFEDLKSGNFYRVDTARNSDKLVSIINKMRSVYSDNRSIINYSVDLKFDEVFGSQKAVLSPTVPVYSTPVKMPRLNAVNPLIDESGEINKNVIEKILPVFKINTNTVRRYSEANGTMVFVENNGILKIHPNGVLSYQSTDSDGFFLSSGNSYVETVSALADFTDKVNDACMAESDLFVSNILSPSSETVTFDYRANGSPVHIEFGGIKNAVKAEVKNGAMTSYVQILRNYTQGNELYDTPAYIEALDNAIEKYSQDMNKIEIQKMYLAYKDEGSPTPISADWVTEVKSIIINEEELK